MSHTKRRKYRGVTGIKIAHAKALREEKTWPFLGNERELNVPKVW